MDEVAEVYAALAQYLEALLEADRRRTERQTFGMELIRTMMGHTSASIAKIQSDSDRFHAEQTVKIDRLHREADARLAEDLCRETRILELMEEKRTLLIAIADRTGTRPWTS